MKVIKLLAVILVGILVTGCSGKKNETNSTNEQSSSSSERFPDSMDDKEAFNATVNSSSTANEKKATQIEMVETDNGYFKVTLLENWQTVDTKELSDTADLAFKNMLTNEYFTVFSESKEGFSDFEEFKKSIDLSDLGEIKSEEAAPIEYNGLKGERRTIVARKDDVDVFYMYDLLEGMDYYLQCVGWTLESERSTNEEDLKTIMTSLIELNK